MSGHPDIPSIDYYPGAERDPLYCAKHGWPQPAGASPMVNLFDLAAWESVEPDYCGCCGDVCPTDALWCDRCAEHVDTSDLLFTWDRTYFAQHGVDCPFQAAPAAPPEAQP